MGASLMTRAGRAGALAAALILALLVSLGAAGCGGGGNGDRLSKSEYEAKVKQIGSDLTNSLTPLREKTQNLGQLETKVGQAQTRLQTAAQGLRKLNPPKDAEADTKKLATALDALARVFNNLKQALASNDLAKVQKTAEQYRTSPAARDLTAATQDLKKKGYNIGALGAQ